jgi:hypothetical protein
MDKPPLIYHPDASKFDLKKEIVPVFEMYRALGSGRNFDDAITDYASAYADQVEKDYDAFHAAVRAGRFPTETSSSEVETPSDSPGRCRGILLGGTLRAIGFQAGAAGAEDPIGAYRFG